MPTPVEIDLQLLHEESSVASHPKEQQLLEQSANGAAKHVVTSRLKKISHSLLTLLGCIFVYAAMSTVTAFYATVAENHNVATYTSGFVIGVPHLCLALFAPLIGYFLPHLGFKFTQVAGLFLTGGSEVLFGFVPMMPTPTLFIIFSFLLKVVEGIGLAMFSTASLAVLTQLFSQRKGTLASLIALPTAIGYAIGVPIGGVLQEVGGFILPFMVFGGFNLILTLLLLVIVHPTEHTSANLPWRLVLRMLHNISFVLLILCAVISLGTYNSLMSYFGRFLSNHFAIRVGIIGIIYMSGLVMNTLASLSAGPIADKLKIPRYLLVGGLVVGFAGCVLIGPATFLTAPKLWLSILAWVVLLPGLAFAMVPVYPAMFEALKMLHVEEAVLASTLAGILLTSYAAGAFLGPVAGGALVYHIGFQWMAAALVLVIAIAIQKIWGRKMNTKKC